MIQEKSFAFAARVVRLSQFLTAEKREFALSKQLLRCGTSIGANVEEAIGGHYRAGFFSKLSIAYKEVREADNWLRLLHETDHLSVDRSAAVHENVEELFRIPAAIKKMTVVHGKNTNPPNS